jgi:CheY-like chemotaxis protein
MLGSIQPDLILLDATMPDMDGNAVCAAIRANRATADTAVIFFTGSDDPENREAARAAGATGYLVKPVPIPVLIQRVAEYIERTSRSKGPFR